MLKCQQPAVPPCLIWFSGKLLSPVVFCCRIRRHVVSGGTTKKIKCTFPGVRKPDCPIIGFRSSHVYWLKFIDTLFISFFNLHRMCIAVLRCNVEKVNKNVSKIAFFANEYISFNSNEIVLWSDLLFKHLTDTENSELWPLVMRVDVYSFSPSNQAENGLIPVTSQSLSAAVVNSYRNAAPGLDFL